MYQHTRPKSEAFLREIPNLASDQAPPAPRPAYLRQSVQSTHLSDALFAAVGSCSNFNARRSCRLTGFRKVMYPVVNPYLLFSHRARGEDLKQASSSSSQPRWCASSLSAISRSNSREARLLRERTGQKSLPAASWKGACRSLKQWASLAILRADVSNGRAVSQKLIART